MARNSVDEWSVTSSQNTDIGGTNIGEHCPLSGINNAIRKVMAQTKAKFDSIESGGSVVSEDINRMKTQIAVNATNSSPATSEKIGTVKLINTITDDNDEFDGSSSTAVTPAAVVNYVNYSADYGTLDSIIPNETVDSRADYATTDTTLLTE